MEDWQLGYFQDDLYNIVLIKSQPICMLGFKDLTIILLKFSYNVLMFSINTW